MIVAINEDIGIAVMSHQAPPMMGRSSNHLEAGPFDEVVGNKAFKGEPQRNARKKHGAKAVISPLANRVNPEPFDKDVYPKRNRIERLFAKLKEFRRVATRYEKLKVTYLGWLRLAATDTRIYPARING